jgi:hypothetical protein
VIPSLREWHEKYESEGLMVIGNHYPEFNYEKDLDHLKDAIKDLNVPYPVLQDNEGKNWTAFKVQYWPTLFLVDRQGHIRLQHIGEGRYSEIEEAIQVLLAE